MCPLEASRRPPRSSRSPKSPKSPKVTPKQTPSPAPKTAFRVCPFLAGALLAKLGTGAPLPGHFVAHSLPLYVCILNTPRRAFFFQTPSICSPSRHLREISSCGKAASFRESMCLSFCEWVDHSHQRELNQRAEIEPRVEKWACKLLVICVSLFPTLGVGSLDFKLNSSPRPKLLSSPGTLLLARSTPRSSLECSIPKSPRSVPQVPSPKCPIPSPKFCLECPTPESP